MPDRVPVCLSIAGSDSGGGAGIQADLKAFAHAGVHGTTALTALTAQNTTAVTGVHPVPPEFIVEQVRAVADDLGVDAVKIGMVGSARATEAVAWALDELPRGTPVVLDPVMVAESGARLLEADAEDALRDLLLPRATVATPNLMEARVLVARRHARRRGARAPRPRPWPGRRHRHRRPSRRGRGPVLRRRVVRRDSRPAAPGWGGPWLRLHALLDARRPARAWRGAARRGPHRARRRGRGGSPGAARARRRRGSGGCAWRVRSPAHQVRFAIIATMEAER